MSRLLKGIIIFTILGAVLFPVLSWIDAFELLCKWSRFYENIEIDELFILFPILIFFFAIFLGLQVKEIIYLNQKLQVSNKELKVSQSQLVQSAKLASVGEMIAAIVHEINNPLGVINMAVDVSLILHEQGKYDLIEEHLRAIKEQTKRASVIVNHLLEFGRDAGLEKQEDININEVIDKSFILFNKDLSSKNIEVIQQLSEDLPLVKGNVIELEQVFINLFSNAENALKSSSKKQLTVRSFHYDGFVVVEVEDTGCGIPFDVKSKIFDSFFTTKEKGEGTGLGLSISYKIIQNHKGTISVQSEEGKGTKFIIQIPMLEDT